MKERWQCRFLTMRMLSYLKTSADMIGHQLMKLWSRIMCKQRCRFSNGISQEGSSTYTCMDGLLACALPGASDFLARWLPSQALPTPGEIKSTVKNLAQTGTGIRRPARRRAVHPSYCYQLAVTGAIDPTLKPWRKPGGDIEMQIATSTLHLVPCLL